MRSTSQSIRWGGLFDFNICKKILAFDASSGRFKREYVVSRLESISDVSPDGHHILGAGVPWTASGCDHGGPLSRAECQPVILDLETGRIRRELVPGVFNTNGGSGFLSFIYENDATILVTRSFDIFRYDLKTHKIMSPLVMYTTPFKGDRVWNNWIITAEGQRTMMVTTDQLESKKPFQGIRQWRLPLDDHTRNLDRVSLPPLPDLAATSRTQTVYLYATFKLEEHFVPSRGWLLAIRKEREFTKRFEKVLKYVDGTGLDPAMLDPTNGLPLGMKSPDGETSAAQNVTLTRNEDKTTSGSYEMKEVIDEKIVRETEVLWDLKAGRKYPIWESPKYPKDEEQKSLDEFIFVNGETIATRDNKGIIEFIPVADILRREPVE